MCLIIQGSPKKFKKRPEVKQNGTKRVQVVSDKAKVSHLVLGYKTPSLRQALADENIADWEPYALEVLATVLGGYEGARLDASIVRRKKLATTTSISYSLATLLPDLLTISAIPREGISLEKLESALKKEISTLFQNPPSAKELEKVIAQTIAESVFQKDSIAYQAILIGSLDSVGLDWRLKDTYLQNIKSVTAEQVRFVTGKYLKPKSLTVISLIPKFPHIPRSNQGL